MDRWLVIEAEAGWALAELGVDGVARLVASGSRPGMTALAQELNGGMVAAA